MARSVLQNKTIKNQVLLWWCACACSCRSPLVASFSVWRGSSSRRSIGIRAMSSNADVDAGGSSNSSNRGAPPPLTKAYPYRPPVWANNDVLTKPPVHGRLRLANLPTPLHRVNIGDDSENYNNTLTLKRDDGTGGVELGGNKLRKLEFLLAAALARGSDAVVTIGGEQSNHCRATAAAARLLGLEAHLVLRTSQKELQTSLTGNLLFDRVVGSHVYTHTPGEYGRFGAERLVELVCEQLRSADGGSKNPYAIPVGGSNGLGSWGYLEAVDELCRQYEAQDLDLPDHVVLATGSGGTATGIVLGFVLACRHSKHLKMPTLHAVAVCDDEDYFYQKMATVADEMGLRLPLDEDEDDSSTTSTPDFFRRHVIVHQGKGQGYARSTPEELEFCTRFARETGVVLDPVYTGKAWYHFWTQVVPDTGIVDSNILFWHTGGALGLYDRQEELLGLVGSSSDQQQQESTTAPTTTTMRLDEVSPVVKMNLYGNK